MDWLKKKKEEAKQAASQAAAKMQNKRSAFKGEGNVLGGAGDSGESRSGSGAPASSAQSSASSRAASTSAPASAPGSAPQPSSSTSSSSRAFKVPGFGKSASEPKPLSEDEKREQREARLRALEERSGAWDKRVANARKARLQQEAELESKCALPPVPTESTSASASASASSTHSTTGVAPRVLSADEMRAFELQSAHASVGFNPYAVVMSSSTEASTAMHSISGSQAGPALTPMAPMPPMASVVSPPPPPSSVSRPSPSPSPSVSSASAIAVASGAPTTAAAAATTQAAMGDAAHLDAALPGLDGAGGVFVLLRQEPALAITAAETIIKMLGNVLQHPQEDKFRRIRVANPSIQTKLVAVRGAVELLAEAGFASLDVDGEQFLVLAAPPALDAARVQAVRDRTEVALIQLQVDSAAI